MEVQQSADSIPMDAKYQLYQEGQTQPPETVQRPLERIMRLYHLWYMCQTEGLQANSILPRYLNAALEGVWLNYTTSRKACEHVHDLSPELQ